MELFGRKARVYLRKNGRVVHTINPGDDTNDQVQVEFSVAKNLSSSANTALIEIWNLAEGTRNAMGKEFDGIILETGYINETGNNVGVIFAGSLRDVEHRRDGTDIISKVECGDGDAALRRAVINETIPAGTKVGDIVDRIQGKFEAEGISRGEVRGLEDLPTTSRPYSMCGSCAREMDRIGRTNRVYWSVQNETFEVIPSDGYLSGITLLTPDTGLIGTPSITDNGVRFDAMMMPSLRPGRLVELQSETLEMNAEGGRYRLGSVTFQGSNRNGDFKAFCHGERLDGGKVDEGTAIPVRQPANVPIPTPRPDQ